MKKSAAVVIPLIALLIGYKAITSAQAGPTQKKYKIVLLSGQNFGAYNTYIATGKPTPVPGTAGAWQFTAIGGSSDSNEPRVNIPMVVQGSLTIQELDN